MVFLEAGPSGGPANVVQETSGASVFGVVVGDPAPGRDRWHALVATL